VPRLGPISCPLIFDTGLDTDDYPKLGKWVTNQKSRFRLAKVAAQQGVTRRGLLDPDQVVSKRAGMWLHCFVDLILFCVGMDV